MPRNTSGLKRSAGPGRPKGSQNRATKEFKQWAENFLKSEAYRRSAEQRILRGRSPQLEVYIAQLMYGKPKDQVEMSGTVQMPTIINRIRSTPSETK